MSLAAGVSLYLASVNLVTFAAFWRDKRAAIRRGWRTPERALLGLVAMGGWLGALAGQHLLRHKTRKEPFRTLLLSTVLVELAALGAWWVLFR